MTTRVLALLGVGLLAGCAGAPPAGPVAVEILANNDFHGNLLPPAGGIQIADPSNKTARITVQAGGAEAMSTLVRQLRAKNPNTIFVAAGDLVGASPLLSALFHDEPTIEALSMMGLETSAVGNPEFDKGKDELLCLQNGGCNASTGCQGPHSFTGAGLQYLAASTFDSKTGKTLFPAYYVKRFEGVPVAFIGLTLKDTPNIVVPSGDAGLSFGDEAETVNALVPKLHDEGIEAIVMLIHQGGYPSGDYNECPGIAGAIVDIVKQLDRGVSVVISGHTHKAYNCIIDGRVVTSGDKFGTIVTEIDLELDRASGKIIAAYADNVIVRTDTYAKDPAETALIAAYRKMAAPLADRQVGNITETLAHDAEAMRAGNGESPLGEIVADAQLAATRDAATGGAVIAFTNSGGIRSGIVKHGDGKVSLDDVFTAQPFNNTLVTVTLTGPQIAQVLEQQWANQPAPRVLQVSRGFSYAYDMARPVGSRVLPRSILLNRRPVDPNARYRVTVNAYLADGGDNFTVLKSGLTPLIGINDAEALEDYFEANSPLSPGRLDRINRLN